MVAVSRYVGQAKVLGPLIGADGDAVPAGVVRPIDQDAAHAHLSHLAEGDFFGSVGHPVFSGRAQSGLRGRTSLFRGYGKL
jgi:hypothetical protein